VRSRLEQEARGANGGVKLTAHNAGCTVGTAPARRDNGIGAQGQNKGEMRAAEVVRLTDLVNYQEGSVVSRTIVKGATGTVTLFAFDDGQGLSEHTAAFDAMAHLIEGEAEITVSGKPLRVTAGEAVLMPANQPHALKALSKFKMLLTMIRS
jgi:quercetin dioxygenase-like cupin family protein